MIDWKRKLTSRKLWLAISLFVSGLLTTLGYKDLAVQIAGCIMQFGAVAAYSSDVTLTAQQVTDWALANGYFSTKPI